MRRTRLLAVAGLALLAASAHAVQECDIDGVSVNPANGNTTKDKTGIMRCREGANGPLQREQELRQGRFMGIERFYRDGVLEREQHVNENGNRDGVSRQYAAPAAPGGKPVLVGEETARNGSTVGLARRWYPTGTPKRVAFFDDASREVAVAEFNADGRLADLRCGDRPVLAPDFDDRKACGFAGDAVVAAFDSKGATTSRTTFRGGSVVRRELLRDGGATRELREQGADGGSEKSFAADGTLRRETQWQSFGERRRVQTLEREFHASGQRIRERQWRVVDRGGQNVGELASEASWYLNGQPKECIAYATGATQSLRTVTRFHDNGVKAEEGSWAVGRSGNFRDYRSDRPIGPHRTFDAAGNLRAESIYDERGKLTRERELDAGGTVLRDDEMFEDGSRKSSGPKRGVGT